MEKLQTFDSLVSKNDFVIKFANVNGSGSASANQMFAKAVFRMGIPVSPKNIFPSNIQGLPTWFEIRINKNLYNIYIYPISKFWRRRWDSNP